MKKLKFDKGAITPFWLQDLEYMQEGIEEVIKGIIDGLSLGEKNMLISGCKITQKNGKISMDSGWFYYEGEILPVKALPEQNPSLMSPIKIALNRKTEYVDEGNRVILKEETGTSASPYEMTYLEPLISSTGDCFVEQGDLGFAERIVAKYQSEDAELENRITQAYESKDAILESRIKALYGNVDSNFQNIESDNYTVAYITKGHVTQIFGEINIPKGEEEHTVQIQGLPNPLGTITMYKQTVDGLKATIRLTVTNSTKTTLRIFVHEPRENEDVLDLSDIIYLSGGNI